ncbi:bifunctional phosphopantothenoylcysteine decarboxylase/phosphopantothenate--cysteine ligase CoaBC [Thermococcus sp. GR7]|uniref:bifunctional phosphopantothenoylcysteine decarboxylase/phosphopantothenate--cysteine ligase CoaBC n=1 Tax=unclassified Thermococcus TaxID=2627626 RepID=UPI0014308B81|nr:MULTISPECIES: bifunctional phosphopantothenoylcysteine decarboxylase/phosphopantothenate--cysteine ligase CoaBC [unclassified Thermococcus]NJE47644.1 bifunctional phosphopantothenoylcysteine decarboxylase/phosphopantothenate--cysteine ligase CoaBC [Thermococcus sp. GR7]NJE78942.1 bifunctional phosphopantothenoylcysteine decarboxylase/phosphopantothenate--cysteine ligase CoaBC [Thermococcus sp. GR4]NJF22592.1 bifunctional phosphopantothenoylcysteine decarboxylase/phosphopantothenate--cysteine 
MLHHVKLIYATKSRKLVGKKIVLAIPGSIAAVECVKLARELIRHGAEVHAVMSESATKIVHPYAMEFATGNPVVTEITGFIEHVELAGDHENKADLVLVCPATANTISKIACGIDDTPVTTVVTTAFAHTPIMIAPAMHSTMYEHPIVAENIEKLKRLGIEFIGPRFEEGKAKVATTEEIVYRVIKKLHQKDLKGKRVLVTAGATREYIDPIRYITNASSGKMGVAMAEEADFRGAEVTLIRTKGSVPSFVENQIEVETVEEMLQAIENELKSKKYDIVVLTAAVSDFRVKNRAGVKIKSGKELVLELEPTPKIIDRVKELQPDVFLVGFKAETGLGEEELISAARKQMERAKSDLVVANTLQAFGSEENEVLLVTKEDVKRLPRMGKRELAERLWDEILQRIL